MFGINQEDKSIMTGTFVDVLEFGKRWSRLYTEQRTMLGFGSFCGTLDEYALALGYSAPASSPFRKRLAQLVSLGLVKVEKCTDELFEENRYEFVWYTDPDPEGSDRGRVCIFVPYWSDLINLILSLGSDSLPISDRTRHGCKDDRKKANQKRRENYRKERREKLCKDCDSHMTDSSKCADCPKNQRKPRKLRSKYV